MHLALGNAFGVGEVRLALEGAFGVGEVRLALAHAMALILWFLHPASNNFSQLFKCRAHGFIKGFPIYAYTTHLRIQVGRVGLGN